MGRRYGTFRDALPSEFSFCAEPEKSLRPWSRSLSHPSRQEGFPNPAEGKPGNPSRRKENPSPGGRKIQARGRKIQGPSVRSCLFKGLRRARAIVGLLWRIKITSMMCKSLTRPPGGTHRFVSNRAGDRSRHVRTNRLSGNRINYTDNFLKVKTFCRGSYRVSCWFERSPLDRFRGGPGGGVLGPSKRLDLRGICLPLV